MSAPSGASDLSREQRQRLVEYADDNVSIVGVLRRLDVFVPDVDGLRSYKTFCVFGGLHPDGGLEKALRVYPGTNSAYCFAGCGRFSPVTLWQQVTDQQRVEAAADLLRVSGLPDPLAVQPDLARAVPPVDLASLELALRTYASRVGATDDQLARCCALLPQVVSPADAGLWLSTSKRYIMSSSGGSMRQRPEGGQTK